jgi:tetratricopeptide (TPR) repeat protein
MAAPLLAGVLGHGWGTAAGQAPGVAEMAPQAELRHGRELLMSKDFAAAKQVFAGYLQGHPDAVQARLGLGDAELGLHEYEAAETTYRQVTAQQPELWQAHKNLVVVEAALGRWEDFDRERTVLQLARQRGAPGISARESDVIDSFNVRGQHWVVRAYFEPVGRSKTRYNFERFSPEGRVQAYISLEDAAAARAALTPGDVRIGVAASPGSASNEGALGLNWYTGTAHGSVRRYTREPQYEQLRADVMRWIQAHPAKFDSGPKR